MLYVLLSLFSSPLKLDTDSSFILVYSTSLIHPSISSSKVVKEIR